MSATGYTKSTMALAPRIRYGKRHKIISVSRLKARRRIALFFFVPDLFCYPAPAPASEPLGTAPDNTAAAELDIQSGIQSGTQSDIQSDKQSGIQSDIQSDIQSGTQSGIQSGIQSHKQTHFRNVRETMKKNIQSDIQSNIQSDIQNQIFDITKKSKHGWYLAKKKEKPKRIPKTFSTNLCRYFVGVFFCFLCATL